MLVTLGKYLGQDLSSLSQAARRLELRVVEDAGLQERVEKVKKRIPICQTLTSMSGPPKKFNSALEKAILMLPGE